MKVLLIEILTTMFFVALGNITAAWLIDGQTDIKLLLALDACYIMGVLVGSRFSRPFAEDLAALLGPSIRLEDPEMDYDENPTW